MPPMFQQKAIYRVGCPLTARKPFNFPFSQALSILPNKLAGLWLVDPLPLQNEHERLFSSVGSLRKREGFLISRECLVVIIATTRRIYPHAVFEHFIIDVTSAALGPGRICPYLVYINRDGISTACW